MRLKVHDCMYKMRLFTIEVGGTLVTMVCKLLKQILNMKNTAIYLVVWFLLRVHDLDGPYGLVSGTDCFLVSCGVQSSVETGNSSVLSTVASSAVSICKY